MELKSPMISNSEAKDILLAIINDSTHTDYVNLDIPHLRYLTHNQATNWIGVSDHRASQPKHSEVLIFSEYIDSIPFTGKSLNIIDLGCGSGKKASGFINILSNNNITVNSYMPIDINSKLILHATNTVVAETHLRFKQCFPLVARFERMPLKSGMWEKTLGTNVFLFLGNTFSNFQISVISELLASIVLPPSSVIIGLKTRSSSFNPDNIVSEYTSYGNDFTYTIGEILNINNKNMKRRVTYNQEEHRVEIWLEVILNGKSLNLLTCSSYRHTITDITQNLENFFELDFFSIPDMDDVLIHCKPHGQ